MNSKKHGSESLQAEEAVEDFFTAAECAYDLLQEFEEMGLSQGPALGGALTQIISYLLAYAPDTHTAMGMLSSCISNATVSGTTNIVITHPTSDKVH